MQPRILEQIPRYGWNRLDLGPVVLDPFNVTMTNVVERKGGLFRASIYAFVALGAATGTGRFSIALEGSQFGDTTNPDEWEIIAELSSEDLFVAPSPAIIPQQRLLGATLGPLGGGFRGEGQVSVLRYKFIRIRTFIVDEDAGDPVDYSVQVRLTGIYGDGESMERVTTLTKPAEAVVSPLPIGAAFKRPEGTRYMTAQCKVLDMILSPLGSDGYVLILQGAVSEKAKDAGNWITIDITPVKALVAIDDAEVFKQGQIALIDMGPFEYFRFAALLAVGAPPNLSGPLSSFTIQAIATFDDNDWLDGDIGISRLNESLQETFCQVEFGTPQAQVGDTIDVTIQILDINTRPLNATRMIGIVVSDGIAGVSGGQLDPSATATITAISEDQGLPGSASFVFPSAGGASEVIVKLDSAGTATLTIDDGGVAGDYTIEAFNYVPDIGGSPPDEQFQPGQVLIATQRTTLTYT